MATFPALDFMQIRARYPKAVDKVKEWVFSQEELKAVTADFVSSQDPEGSKEQFVGLLIQMDPRKLYDIFDSFGIYVSIKKDLNADQWEYSTNEENGLHYAPSRHTAEVTAFHDAFEILEKQL